MRLVPCAHRPPHAHLGEPSLGSTPFHLQASSRPTRLNTFSESRPKLTSYGRPAAFADAACAPIDFPIAPAHAIPLALKKAGLTIADISRFEINEAFSAVALANQKILAIDSSKLNVNGGAVACVFPPRRDFVSLY